MRIAHRNLHAVISTFFPGNVRSLYAAIGVSVLWKYNNGSYTYNRLILSSLSPPVAQLMYFNLQLKFFLFFKVMWC